jgi:hypothetical protein
MKLLGIILILTAMGLAGSGQEASDHGTQAAIRALGNL